MKLLMLTITAIGLMSFGVFEGRDIPANEVPESVKSTFEKNFPNAYDIDWEKKGKEYEVDFEVDDVDFSARFDPNGKLLMHKEDMRASDIPEAVKATIQQDFKDYHIDDVEKIEKDGKVYYQVELDGKLMDRKEVFTENGEKESKVKYWD